MRPADLPLDIGERSPHGTRTRYVGARCRCDECKAANREFYHRRVRAKIYGDWNGLVDAGPVRAHLLKLRAAGIGRRSVSDIARVPESTVGALATGRKTQLRARTAKRILAVTADAALNGATLVPGAELLERLEHLREFNGWTCKELARRMGYRGNAIQFRDPMTARNARKVELFLRDWMLQERA